jgi:hypothetical protein
LYQGFKKEKGFFIATPEKMLLDAIYLMSYGRYALDMSAIDPKKLILRSSWVLSLKVTLVTIMPPTDSVTSKKN